jgi:hypothetical protein
MKPTNSTPLIRSCLTKYRHSLVICLAAAFVTTYASAQEGGLSPWLRVAVVQVKGGEAAEFQDLLKDFIAARRASGLPGGQVFQVTLGHPNEWHYVIPVQSISDNENAPLPMSSAEAAIWTNRITATTENVRFSYAITFPQHGVEAPANSPAPTMLMLRKIRVAEGMQAEYESWVEDQYMPAFRQSGALGHVMSHSIYGDSLRNYYHAYPLAGWEDLEGPDPLIEILGQRRYDQVFGALDEIVTEHEMVIARIRFDIMGQ